MSFVNTTTLQAISSEPVRHLLFDEQAEAAMGHIELARWADYFLICPATANTIAKFAHGIADNLLTTLYLATDAQIVLAPAMNRVMWEHPATIANLQQLAQRPKHQILPVASGYQACGEYGEGRLLSPTEIVAALQIPQDFQDQKIVITAGPTQEAIDPVRYLSNHSSGKMGYALAAAAAQRGAEVILISGPTALSCPPKVTRIDVTSALEMYDAALSQAISADIFIAAAAVADYRVAQVHPQKHKKREHGALTLQLVENPDIVASVAALPAHQRPYTIGFSAETEQVIPYAQQKRERKKLDIIIANDVSHDVFGSNHNQVTLITATNNIPLPKQSKHALADKLLTLIHQQMTHNF